MRNSTRRTLLTTAALAVPAVVLPAAALAAEAAPDPWPELERRFFHFYRWEGLLEPVDDDDPRIAEYEEGWQQAAAEIIATPAVTIAGIRTKVRVLALELTDGESAYGEDLAASLLADLDRLAG
jgi:hypothetical protein